MKITTNPHNSKRKVILFLFSFHFYAYIDRWTYILFPKKFKSFYTHTRFMSCVYINTSLLSSN